MSVSDAEKMKDGVEGGGQGDGSSNQFGVLSKI